MLQANLLPWREAQKNKQRWQLAWLVCACCAGLFGEALFFQAYDAHLKHNWIEQHATGWQEELDKQAALQRLSGREQQQRAFRSAMQVALQADQELRRFLMLLNCLESALPELAKIKRMVFMTGHIRLELVLFGDNSLLPLLKNITDFGHYQEPIVRLGQEQGKRRPYQLAHIDIPLGL